MNDESRPQLKILVVEDNPVNQQVARSLLKRRGHAVDVVGDGQAAVDAVKQSAYDVVLMDIQMPVLDGLSATMQMRAIAGLENLPIIAVTAHTTPEDRQRCMAAGMDAFLSKPFKPVDLFEIVERTRRSIRQAPPEQPAVAASEADPAVDIEGFRATLRAAGIEDIVESTLRLYLEEAPQRMDTLKQAVAAGKCPEIEKAAHAFKSSSAAIGAKALAETLLQAERAGKSANLTRCVRLMEKIQECYSAVVSQLERAVADSNNG